LTVVSSDPTILEIDKENARFIGKAMSRFGFHSVRRPALYRRMLWTPAGNSAIPRMGRHFLTGRSVLYSAIRAEITKQANFDMYAELK
jgi:hypothetical protein